MTLGGGTFADRAGVDQAGDLKRAARNAEWDVPKGRIGGVILQLRARAAEAQRRAWWLLVFLIIVIFAGLGFYLGLPLLEQFADGRKQTLDVQISEVNDRIESILEKENKAAEEFHYYTQDLPRFFPARYADESAHLFTSNGISHFWNPQGDIFEVDIENQSINRGSFVKPELGEVSEIYPLGEDDLLILFENKNLYIYRRDSEDHIFVTSGVEEIWNSIFDGSKIQKLAHVKIITTGKGYLAFSYRQDLEGFKIVDLPDVSWGHKFDRPAVITTGDNKIFLKNWINPPALHLIKDSGLIEPLLVEGEYVESIISARNFYLLQASSGKIVSTSDFQTFQKIHDGLGSEVRMTNIHDEFLGGNEKTAFLLGGKIWGTDINSSWEVLAGSDWIEKVRGIEPFGVDGAHVFWTEKEVFRLDSEFKSVRNLIELDDYITSVSIQNESIAVLHGDRFVATYHSEGESGFSTEITNNSEWDFSGLTIDGLGRIFVYTGDFDFAFDEKYFVSLDGGASFRAIVLPNEVKIVNANVQNSIAFFGDLDGVVWQTLDGGLTFKEVYRRNNNFVGVPHGADFEEGSVIPVEDGFLVWRRAGRAANHAKPLGESDVLWNVGEMKTDLSGTPESAKGSHFFRDLEARLNEYEISRKGLEPVLESLRSQREVFDLFPYSYIDRERARLAFDTYLTRCRGGVKNDAANFAELTKTCMESWRAEQAQATSNWWQTLATQVPPGILLLFLLATLAALYRYNMRLAGFHHSRADALELVTEGIIQRGDAEALAKLALALASDTLAFGKVNVGFGAGNISLERQAAKDS